MGEFCHAYFQRTSFVTDNFQRLFIARKINGQLSALISPRRQATANFQRLFRPIQRTKSTEVTF
jgi:hypothetical protein